MEDLTDASFVVLGRVAEDIVTAWCPELKHKRQQIPINTNEDINPGDYLRYSYEDGFYIKDDPANAGPATGTKESLSGSGDRFVTMETVITALPSDFFINAAPELKTLGDNGAIALSADLNLVYTSKKFYGKLDVGKLYNVLVVDCRMCLENRTEKVQLTLEKQLAKMGTIWCVIGDPIELNDIKKFNQCAARINNSSLWDYTFQFTPPQVTDTSSSIVPQVQVSQDNDQNSTLETPSFFNSSTSEGGAPVEAPGNSREEENIEAMLASLHELPDDRRDKFLLLLCELLDNDQVLNAVKEVMGHSEEVDLLHQCLRELRQG